MTIDVNEVLPQVFVYGTLRQGQHNHRIIQWAALEVRHAVLDGYAMYGTGIPHIVPDDDYRVVGELVTLDESVYGEAMRDLDALEGFRPGRPNDSLYVRRAVEVRVTDSEQQVRAWAYIGGTIARGGAYRNGSGFLIPDGDWTGRCLPTP